MKKKMQFLFSVLLMMGMMFSYFPVNNVVYAEPFDLFFSEYIEGSSNNKALEIYNGTGSSIDLAAGGYNIQMYSNGATTAGVTINLTGTVARCDVFVVAQASANATILAQADQTNSAGWYNGNDAVVLRKGTAILDVIGQIGFDPVTEWGTDLISTANNTLRRLEGVETGDSNGSDVFVPASEWLGYATDTFDGLGSHTSNCIIPPAGPKINEFSASTASTDVEYVEIIGDPDTDYSAFTMLEIEGDFSGTATGTIDEVINVGMTEENGFWLQNLAANSLENGSLTLLLVEGFVSTLGNDLDTNDDGIFDTTPWTAIADAIAVNDGGASDLTYGNPVLGPNYDGLSSFAPGGASRIPDGFDTDAVTDWVRNDFDLAGIPGFTGTPVVGEAYNTPGATNMIFVPPPEACGDMYTSIYDIQGNAPASALDGTEIATEGIVVADLQAGLRGFNIQDPTGDFDSTTSDGIFVYSTSLDVSVGDHVRVRGTVDEYNTLTEITSVSNVWLCSTGNSIPEPTEISLPVTSLDDFEKYEGMLVTFPQDLIISEYFNFDRFGEMVLTSTRHLTPTALYEPGSPEAAQAALDYALDHITLDDGRSTQNPDPAIHPNGLPFTLENLFRGGDLVTNVTGVMDYNFSLWRIQPTQGADYTPANLREATPPDVGGNIKVASFNVLNYFTTLDAGSAYWICGPSLDMECRGADTADELVRQRNKIVAAISSIDADVVGLMEIENNVNDDAVKDLVASLNAFMGEGTYAYVDTGVIGSDAIKLAMIYKPASVSLIGDHAILDSSVDPRFLDTKNRPVLAQSFQEPGTGTVFTVAVNHLKSKGSACDDVLDPDLGDGAGNCNLTRQAAAQALVDWLDGDPTGSGSINNLIIGDLNSYDKEDPIDAIKLGADDTSDTADDFIDLVYKYQGDEAYGYVFDGQIGYLDHALVNKNLESKVTSVAFWHINADEPDLIDYDMTFKKDAQDLLYAPDAFRSSDHDPVLIGLDICEAIPPTLEVSVTPDTLWSPNHKYVEVHATVTASDNFDTDPTITLISVTSNEPDDADGKGDGETVDDIVIVDDFNFLLRAERAGNGSGRVYTITYSVIDDCGNETIQSATVTVPKSK